MESQKKEGTRLILHSVALDPTMVERFDRLIGVRERSLKIRELIAAFVKDNEPNDVNVNP